nr:DUF1761 domain-containing protein [Planctomycetota bacterium]
MENLNVFAVLVAAISSFMLGGLWYSPALFGTVWCREAGVDPKADGRHPAKVFGTAFAFTLVAAALLGWFLGPTPELREALHLSLLIGAGF